MTKKKSRLDRFAELSWNDLEDWAGGKIVSRGRNYQRQGRVGDLAVTTDNALIAWVSGRHRYATKVTMDDGGTPASVCTCPYGFDCKHGVAAAIEYAKRLEDGRPVPEAGQGDPRLTLVEGDRDDEPIDEEMVAPEDVRKEMGRFLKSKTKAQLVELIHDIAQRRPEVAREVVDRQALTSGRAKTVVTRLRREIQAIGDEPGWWDDWRDVGHTPDYSSIRQKLAALLDAGHADEVLALGRELVFAGIRQVEQIDDRGGTAVEIAACVPLIVKALDASSLDDADRLSWALDAELEDQYEVCEALARYLRRRHPKAAWGVVADRLLARLKMFRPSGESDGFNQRYERGRISNWAIHALDRAGRKDEIVPLCEAEAEKVGDYGRLIDVLVSARRYEEAERWVQEGIRATEDKWPGIVVRLRGQFLDIRTRQKNWHAVAAMQAEEFVSRPSLRTFVDCKKAAGKVKVWPEVREVLLGYLENGEPPWRQGGWPLPESGLDAPEPGRKDRFPMASVLIDLAILEKDPERVLYWYDRLPNDRYGYGAQGDAIATAVRTYAPDRAVAIWKDMAERLIDRVQPAAYQEAGTYLRKAAKVMGAEKKRQEWARYLRDLRQRHVRKTRLMEVLDGLEGKPIAGKRRRRRR